MTNKEKLQLIIDSGYTAKTAWEGYSDLTNEQQRIVDDLRLVAESSPYKHNSNEYRSLYQAVEDKEKEFVAINSKKIQDLGKIKNLDTSDAYDGSNVSIVIHFVDLDIIVKSEGEYYSYDGLQDMTEWKEAKPEQVTITVYNYV